MRTDLESKSDLELVNASRAGHKSSFSELVRRHQKGLLRLSLRFMRDLDLAEDIVQETFIKAYEKLNSFEGRASFKSWLFQIGVNTARNRLRDSRMNMTDISQIQIAVGAEAESILVHTAVADIIQQEVDKLPFRQRTALMLRIYEDMSFKEIADVMECPYDTAKANFRHALLKLRDVFESNLDLQGWTESAGALVNDMNNQMEVEG